MRITIKRVSLSVVVFAMSVLPSLAQSNMNTQEQANLKFVLDWWREVIQSRHMELAPPLPRFWEIHWETAGA